MTFWRCLLAVLCGYVAGSIPFSLLIVRVFGHGQKLQKARFEVPGTDDVLRSDVVSATAVRLQLGSRYGCLTSLLDMAKAAAVTFAFRIAYPDAPTFLVASGFVVVGHIWPIFNRFRGGRGQSPVIGSLLVLDWPTPLIAYPLAQILGFATRSRAYVGRFAPLLIASAWLFLRFGDLAYVYYCGGLFLIRVLAMRREIKQYTQIRKAGGLRTFAEEAELMGFGRVYANAVLRVRALMSKLKGRRGA